MSIPATTERVEQNTGAEINEEIRRKTERNVSCCLNADHEMIEWRLDQLNREWDTERVLEANAAALSLFGVIMGATRSRAWLLLPTAVTGFLLQHSLQGWCPPLPVLRRLGVRTAREINDERTALKALRGDFEKANSDDRSAKNVLELVRK